MELEEFDVLIQIRDLLREIRDILRGKSVKEVKEEEISDLKLNTQRRRRYWGRIIFGVLEEGKVPFTASYYHGQHIPN